MGNAFSINNLNKVNFENIQDIINNNNNNNILLNTLLENKQYNIIKNTISIMNEETIINKLIDENNFEIKIFIYGENSSDMSIIKKYNQLKKHGFKHIYIYIGGLFEWLLLQDIFGDELFPTTKLDNNFLDFKPSKLSLL